MEKLGKIKANVTITVIVPKAAVTPSRLKSCTKCLRAPSSKLAPMMPFKIIITAAKMVSRAKPMVASPPDIIIDTINATSIIVTAKANTKVPKGSPTRWAITSAWCTAATTLPTKPMVNKATMPKN